MRRILLYYKNLLLDNTAWFKRVTLLFVFAILAGVVVYFYNPNLIEYILKVFEDKFGPELKLDFSLVTALFTSNLIAAGIALFGGIVLGIAPFLVTVMNGFLLGYVAVAVGEPFTIIAGVLPHAVFEVPALLIASGLGLKLGLRWLSRGASGIRLQTLMQDLKTAFLALPLIALMLFIAGLIEVYVSGNIIK